MLGTAAIPAAAARSGEPARSVEPADVDGDPVASADALSDRAKERFEARDFEGAVELFTAAHALDPQPNYLFNVGRVYEEKGDLARAVEYYQRFLGEPGVDLESRGLATERLRVLREALEQLRTETKSDAEEPPPPPVATHPDDGGAAPADTAGPPGKDRKLRITGYSLLGVGGAALLAGSVVGGVALRITRDADDAMFVDEQASLRREARTRAAAADALFVSGGVLAAVGLVIVLSTLGPGRRTAARRHRERATTWAPLVTREGAAVSVTHQF